MIDLLRSAVLFMNRSAAKNPANPAGTAAFAVAQRPLNRSGSIRFRSCVVVLAVMIAGTNGRGEDVRHEPQGKSIKTVRVEDIPKTVQLIGRLNHPLGDLLTIRGEWKMPSGLSKCPSLAFHVTSINGKKPEKKVSLNILQVKPVRKNRGRESKPDDPWDWKYDLRGKQPAPAPAEDEVWEMLGVETGSFKHYSPEASQQIGLELVQTPIFLTGFVTYFEFVAVKKIQK